MLQESKNPENVNYKELAYRYQHTLRLIECLSAILRGDYTGFQRLDIRAMDKGEQYLTESQFEKLSERVWFVLNTPKKRRFMMLLALTHDYGCLYDLPTHFIISGDVCVNDFQMMGYSKQAPLARLIVGNHSYFGDLLLGEVSFDYGKKLIKNAEVMGEDSNDFWHLLWILNVLDINSVNGGFLSKEKYIELSLLYNKEGIVLSHQDFLKQKLTYLFTLEKAEKLIKEGSINPEFTEVYSQYFHYLIKQDVFSEQKKIELINMLTDIWQQASKKYNFEYIAFSSDNEDAAQKILKALNMYIDGKQDIFTVEKGKILGFPFTIEHNYLRIELGNRH